MADMIVLEASKRTVTGKEVRHLRAQGLIPGVLYGPEFEALHLQIPWADLRPTLLEVGGSKIIELHIDGETYNALVRDVQRAPLRGDVLHIDFYRVRMDVVIRTEVPIAVSGNTEPIEELGGIVVQEMTSIEVECLPTHLPAQIEVDVSGLEEVGDLIAVADLPELEGVTYMANDDDVVVSSTYPRAAVEEEEEEEEETLIEEGEEPKLIRRQDDEGFDEDEEDSV